MKEYFPCASSEPCCLQQYLFEACLKQAGQPLASGSEYAMQLIPRSTRDSRCLSIRTHHTFSRPTTPRGMLGGFLVCVCYTEKAAEARHRLERQYNACANRKKQWSVCGCYPCREFCSSSSGSVLQRGPESCNQEWLEFCWLC